MERWKPIKREVQQQYTLERSNTALGGGDEYLFRDNKWPETPINREIAVFEGAKELCQFDGVGKAITIRAGEPEADPDER